jgi:hypothetical protein
MSWLPPEVGTMIWKGLARAVGGPRFLARAGYVAMVSVAETLLGMLNKKLITDIGRLKEAALGKMEAETKAAQADAAKKLAEAAEAANRANLLKRTDAIARAEKEQARQQAAKTAAEAEAVRKDAETRRLQGIIDAACKVLDSASKLKQEGGQPMFNEENLKKVMDHAVRALQKHTEQDD